jgi:two-component system, cell cycle sensor histidine kinase and response regulator CckA
MKTEAKIILTAVAFGLFIWLFDAVVDFIMFIEGTFWGVLLFDVPDAEIFMRLILLICTIGFGFTVARIMTKRRQAEESLRESEEKYRQLYQRAPLGYQSLDINGNFIEVNDAWLQTLGYVREEVIGRWFGDFIAPEYQEVFKNNFPRFKKIGAILGVEFEMVRKDGSEIIVTFDGRIGHNAEGEFQQTHCILHDITERKKAEDALRDSEERFRILSESSPIGIFHTDTEGSVLYLNDCWCSITGMKRQDALGFGWVSAIHPDDKPRVMKDWTQCLEQNKGYNGEFRFVNDAGESRWVLTQTSPIYSSTGDITGHVGANEDITERKVAEKALQKERDRAQEYLDIARVMIVALNDRGEVTLINKKGCELLGYQDNELIYKNWFKHCLPAQMREDVLHVFSLLMSGEVQPVEYYENIVVTKQGEERLVAWNNNILTNEEGCITGILSSGEDITERKQAEESLARAQKERLRMFNLIPDMLAIADSKSGYLTQVNPVWSHVLGYSEEELLSRPLFEFIHPDDHAETTAEMQKQISGISTYRFENRYRCADGSYRLLEWHATPADEQGFLYATARDVTKYKQDEEARRDLEHQLQQAQKMESIGRLAGCIAHDYNNALGVMMGNAELLKDKYQDTSSFEGRAINQIIQGAKRGADLTAQLLGFARSGKYHPVALDINDTIREVVTVSEKIFEKNIAVDYDLEESLRSVNADKNQMHQVLTNLLINAKDAMPSGGTLLFKTDRAFLHKASVTSMPELSTGEYVRIAVSDTGTGMSKDVVEKIFEPFYTTKGIGKGTGLGLAMVYGIVNNHGGNILCESEPGVGTTFILLLPVSDDEEEVNEKIVEKPIMGEATILLADDEPGMRDALKRMLEKLGYTVMTAEDGVETVSIYTSRQDSIDLVLLDMIMPNMAGADTYQELRKLNQNVKVLIISGYSQDERANKILEEGVLGFLQKPFQLYELSKTVSEALAKE